MEKDDKDDKSLLKDILDNIHLDMDADRDNRKEMLDDLKFCTLDQWPEELRQARENDPNGARPCLTIDKINQYITQVVNDMRQNRPSIKTRPVDDNADIETAKVFQGLIRHIEDKSSASIAYENAGEWTTRVGRGYFRVTTDYIGDSFDQEISIKPIPDAFSVYLGPHIMPDGSDAKRGTIMTDIPVEEFKRLYPGKKYEVSDFGEDIKGWREENSIRVAEHFYTEYEDTELLYLKNGKTVLKSDFDGAQSDIVKSRKISSESQLLLSCTI